MAGGNLNAYTVKIRQLAWAGVFFAASMLALRGLMFGQSANMWLLVVAVSVLGVVLALDKYYWLTCPAFFVLGMRLPGLPFDGRELGCLSIIGVYFIRQALHKEHPVRLTAQVAVVLPLFLWICMIWVLNPAGIAMFGSSSVGGRFYLKIVLGFMAFLVLSTLRLTERDCEVLFYCLLACSAVAFLHTAFAGYFRPVDLGGMDGGELEASARYELLGAMALYTLVFSRYSLSTILLSVGKLLFVLVCAVITVYSGKRRAFGTLVLVPVLRSFFTGRDKMLTFACCMFGAMFIGFAVAGHGSLWTIPLSAQRALSVVVPEFGTDSVAGAHDLFRSEVRRYGREVIKANPWFGRKGFVMNRNEMSWVVFSQTTNLFEGHAFSGNWHSTWYAFACDFGLPAMFLWGIFIIYALTFTYRGFRCYRFGHFTMAVYTYYAMSLFLDTTFSYTSGHSALTSTGMWVVYGMILAVRNGLEDARINSVGAGIS